MVAMVVGLAVECRSQMPLVAVPIRKLPVASVVVPGEGVPGEEADDMRNLACFHLDLASGCCLTCGSDLWEGGPSPAGSQETQSPNRFLNNVRV
jgi:hypothetical protein